MKIICEYIDYAPVSPPFFGNENVLFIRSEAGQGEETDETDSTYLDGIVFF